MRIEINKPNLVKKGPCPLFTMRWLGQAGFDFCCAGRRFLVDPYLSDSLAEKYRGKKFAHERMMPPPVAPQELTDIDLVFCTHGHTDHMDPGTLPVIAASNPNCRFVVPAAKADYAVDTVGLERESLVPVDAGSRFEICDFFAAGAVLSAHEEPSFNERGESEYLGFVFELCGAAIYHPGDCAPFDGLVEQLAGRDVDIAIMPVNGRDAFRAANGVPGNFHFDEAVEVCVSAGIGILVPCHFGMFDFNTVDPDELRKKAEAETRVRVIVPDVGETFEVC